MSVDKFGRHSTSQVFLEPAVSSRFISNNFLRRDGSNDVQGEINMNNHKLVMLSEPTESQDAATRGYIKNFTRNNFLKRDGTNNMEGDLDLNNNKIINVAYPVDDGDVINKRYLERNFFRREGDIDLDVGKNKIVNVADPTSAHDVATKNYVDSRKPMITIWAQEVGPLNNGEYEWSFGSGDYTSANCGYCMPTSGRIIRGSLSSVNESAMSAVARVNVVKNGVITGLPIVKSARLYSFTRGWRPPIEVAQDDRINFKTSGSTVATNNIVSLLIELDL